MVLGFAEHGADVVIASRKQEACEELAADVRARFGRRAWGVGCNVSSWEQCDRLAEQAYSLAGQVDVLVNNAGLSPVYPSLEEISEALYDKVLAVNLKGPFRLSVLIGPRMAAAAGGSIINISSTASVLPSPAALPYSAAKAGLNALTLGLAGAFGPSVRVNTIMAGPFLTDVSDAWDMDRFNAAAQTTIMLRRAGSPEEIVGAALYFASSASSFASGSTLRVDGGTHGRVL
jgi:NAD(P)-dependent dehydrogenase (short-subunit alcohol dehydrogenase family)